MKPIRIRLARWLARRDELQARNQRRALRDHNRREETAAARLDRRARARRIYASWITSQRLERQMRNEECAPLVGWSMWPINDRRAA